MKVLLNKDVPKLGYRGDIVNVKKGYFRNFLMPEGLAEVATPVVLKIAESRKENIVMKKEQLMDNAKEVLKKLKGMKITLKAKVSEKGKLYAGITEEDVIKEIEKLYKVQLEKSFVKMEHFKELGEYEAVIDLGSGESEKVVVIVEKE